MKARTFVQFAVGLTLILILLTACDGSVENNFSANSPGGNWPCSTNVFGSGVVSQENRTVIGITGVVLAGEGNLYIEQGAAEELIVTAEDNLLPFIFTEVDNGILEIRTQSNVCLEPTHPIEYHLTVVSLESVVLSGVGDITVSDLVTPQLSLRRSGIGSVEVTNLDADELDVVLSGMMMGDFDISGTVDLQRVNVTGLGDYDARDLASLDAVISIVGNENQTATVRVSDMLTVTINGNGRVFYIGDPFVDADITGSGSVQKIPG